MTAPQLAISTCKFLGAGARRSSKTSANTSINGWIPLRAPLRMSEGNALLEAAIDEAIGRKPKGHDFIIDRRGNVLGRDLVRHRVPCSRQSRKARRTSQQHPRFRTRCEPGLISAVGHKRSMPYAPIS